MTFVLFVLLWNLVLLWAFEVLNWITSIQKVRRWYGYKVTAPALNVEHYLDDITVKLLGDRLQVWLRTGETKHRHPHVRGGPLRKGVYLYFRKSTGTLTCLLGAESQGARVRLIVGKLVADMILRQRRGDDILMVWWGRRFREWVLRPKRYLSEIGLRCDNYDSGRSYAVTWREYER